MTAALEKVKKLSEHVAEKDPDSFERLRELIAKTEKANAKEQDVKDLRAYPNRNPEMWRVVGDLLPMSQFFSELGGRTLTLEPATVKPGAAPCSFRPQARRRAAEANQHRSNTERP